MTSSRLFTPLNVERGVVCRIRSGVTVSCVIKLRKEIVAGPGTNFEVLVADGSRVTSVTARQIWHGRLCEENSGFLAASPVSRRCAADRSPRCLRRAKLFVKCPEREVPRNRADVRRDSACSFGSRRPHGDALFRLRADECLRRGYWPALVLTKSAYACRFNNLGFRDRAVA